MDDAALIEATLTAARDRVDGRFAPHPAWLDLDEASRRAAYDAALVARRLEAALDPAGLSTTARAVLRRIG